MYKALEVELILWVRKSANYASNNGMDQGVVYVHPVVTSIISTFSYL